MKTRPYPVLSRYGHSRLQMEMGTFLFPGPSREVELHIGPKEDPGMRGY